MPPTSPAATTTTSGFLSLSQRSVSACRVRSSVPRSAHTTSHGSRANRRTSAEPTIPRWPATKIRRPLRSNGCDIVVGMLVLATSRRPDEVDGSPSVTAVQALTFEFDFDEVRSHHFLYQVRKTRPVAPSEQLPSLAGVADQAINLGWSKIMGVDLNQHLIGLRVDPGFLDSGATPSD